MDGKVKLRNQQPWLLVTTVDPVQLYAEPPMFDVDAMVAVASNQVEALQDELWLLQTDPPYLHDQAKVLRDTWIDNLPGVKNVKRTYTAFRDHISIGQPTPAKHLRALCCLETLLKHLLNDGSSEDLKQSLVELPSFRKYYSLIHDSCPEDRIVAAWGQEVSLQELSEKDRLMWGLQILSLERAEQRTFDIANALKQFEDHLVGLPRPEAGRISPTVLLLVSETAAIHQILSILRTHRPWFPKGILEVYQSCARRGGDLQQSDKKCRRDETSKQVSNAEGKKDAAWLSSADKAREELTNVWRGFRDDLTEVDKRHDNLKPGLEGYRAMLSHYESPEHLQSLAAERDSILEPKPAIMPEDAVAPKRFQTKEVGPKEKTRPEGVLAEENHAQDQDAASALSSRSLKSSTTSDRIYSIKPRSFRVASLLFPAGPEDKGTTDWMEFVAFMSEVGFRAKHVGGSAFIFECGSQSINFHRPNPSDALGSNILRAISKRLRKLGSERAMFQIAE
ncbi:hypothetical protein OEA41_002749 [Lepraria neglecta]|uniref:Uncharacterized protein n=1 Tax=Lepraria neglecta TaxID=209136 RepID=A0AAE0DHP0_9LECA|nr:hypothetical protein OEA41_002749 [Lepraria neglecta]